VSSKIVQEVLDVLREQPVRLGREDDATLWAIATLMAHGRCEIKTIDDELWVHLRETH
jgi:hypothetical protein